MDDVSLAAILENGGRKSVFRKFLLNYTSYQKKFGIKNVHHNNIYLFCSKHFFDKSNRYAEILIFSPTVHQCPAILLLLVLAVAYLSRSLLKLSRKIRVYR